jgi:hypothetical protein
MSMELLPAWDGLGSNILLDVNIINMQQAPADTPEYRIARPGRPDDDSLRGERIPGFGNSKRDVVVHVAAAAAGRCNRASWRSAGRTARPEIAA